MKNYFGPALWVASLLAAGATLAQEAPAQTSPFLKFMTCDTKATRAFPYSQITVFAEIFTQQSQLMLTGPVREGDEAFDVTSLLAAKTETDPEAGRTKVTAVYNPGYKYYVAVDAAVNAQGELGAYRVSYTGNKTARATCRLERLPRMGH